MIKRRNFIKQASLATAGIGLVMNHMSMAANRSTRKPFVGIQVGSHSLYDEGIGKSLDLMQESAGVNAIFMYATIYQGYSKERQLQNLATDHGNNPIDPQKRNLPLVWMKTHDEFYKDTFMKHWKPTKNHEFYGRDVFDDTIKEASKRGIKVYARILEGYKPFLIDELPGYAKVLSTDVYGNKTHLPCWNHPDYRIWWTATVKDLFSSYNLAGLKWDSERNGPLSELLSQPPWHINPPQCFCEHCMAIGANNNVDGKRAKEGFIKLDQLKKKIKEKNEAPVDGAFITIFRIFMEYPEILAWERLWYESKESLAKDMYKIIKAKNSQAEFGRHIWHMVSFDPIYRAAVDYASMATYADWLKPVVYHESAAGRLRDWTMKSLRQSLLYELPDDMAGEFLYRIFGFDPKVMPAISDSSKDSFPADYVFRETKRCVEAVQGKVPVYPGIGFDIPGQKFPTDPDVLYQTVLESFKVGASGILISREYDEMKVSSLNAVGKAIKEV